MAKAKNAGEKLALEMLAQFENATPEELVKWLTEWAAFRDDPKAEKVYHSVFKAAVERLYLKVLGGKWRSSIYACVIRREKKSKGSATT